MVSIPLSPRKHTLTVKRTALGGGYPCFMCSICGIGLMTAFIGDVASQLGCTSYLKDSVTATTFVALGTSMPGTLLYYFIVIKECQKCSSKTVERRKEYIYMSKSICIAMWATQFTLVSLPRKHTRYIMPC